MDEKSALNWIDSQTEVMLSQLRTWVHIPTYSTYPKGLSYFAKVLSKAFAPLKGHETLLSLPPVKCLDREEKWTFKDTGQVLSIRKREQAPVQVLLVGHMDTVYPLNFPLQEVEETEKGVFLGSGIADMKGGIAILLTALKAFEKTPYSAHLGWHIFLTPDEEIGSPATSSLLKELAPKFHVGLVFEPALPDGSFVCERYGSVTLTLLFKGRAAHVGRDDGKGKSAAFAMARLISLCEKWKEETGCILNVADLIAEGPVNMTIPIASCKLNIRSKSMMQLESGVSFIKEISQRLKSEGIEMEMYENSFRPPKEFDEKTKKLFDRFAVAADSLNIPFHTKVSGGVCDGNILSAAGLPTLDTAGVIGGNLHTKEEYVILKSLAERAKLLFLFLTHLSLKPEL